MCVCVFIHSFIHSFIYLFIYSCIYLFIHLFIYLFIYFWTGLITITVEKRSPYVANTHLIAPPNHVFFA